MNASTIRSALAALLLTLAAGWQGIALAQIQISQSPLSIATPAAPMNMLVMGRDHKLYYQAYNDASDLTGNGEPDVGYKPDEINYYGYFSSFKCYSYSSGVFRPTANTANKRCSGAWSGDFLNYVTTSRIDALRKVLYGGKRSTDTATQTILERAYIPQDAHSWGKEYFSIERDGYDIRQYTPLGLPTAGRYHLFASTNLAGSPGTPRLRVLQNSIYRVWEWVAIERPVAGDRCLHGGSGPTCTATSGTTRQDYNVRVEVCSLAPLESNCRRYPNGNYKPVGLLQRYGETDRMFFGLITGSYRNNTQGGVLRKNVDSLSDEIDLNSGQFTNVPGVIRTINELQIIDFRTGHDYAGGWNVLTPMSQNPSAFPDWGNPIGEMMYESLRYFAGRPAPTPAFINGITVGGDESVTARTPSRTFTLPAPAWNDPYSRMPHCSRAAQLVISDTNPSYDSDSIPGTAFGSFTGDLAGFNANSLGSEIWGLEHGGSASHFIGQVGGSADGAPTAKTVSSLGNIRGLSPEEPTREGSFYAASAARYGLINDLRPELPSRQNVQTFAVALSSPLPRIEFPVGGRTVTIVPFAKSPGGTVGGNNIPNPNTASYLPTNQIVNFFVQQWVNTHPSNMDASINGGRPYAVFRINYEDVEQGADHDMDAIVRYTVSVTADNQLEVSVASEYAAGSIEQHIGYVISGTTNDGVYLEVRDCDTASPWTAASGVLNPPDNTRIASAALTCGGQNGVNWNGTVNGGLGRRGTVYNLYTPNWGRDRPNGTTGVAQAAVLPGQCASASPPAQCAWGLPLSSTRRFAPSANPAATVLESPLWYAAKYGSEANEGLAPGVTPENYMLVTNAATLEQQLDRLFSQILELAQFSGGVTGTSTRVDLASLAFVPEFDSRDWSGDLGAYQFTGTGGIQAEPVWRASERLASMDPADRRILTRRRDGANFVNAEFTFNGLGGAGATGAAAALGLSLAEATALPGGSAASLVNYLRGDQGNEQDNGGPFRNRSSAMGDILGSQPAVRAREDFLWAALPADQGGGASYATFLDAKRSRDPLVFVGSNNGMLHAFRAVAPTAGNPASGGEEIFAYVPWAVQQNLKELADPTYAHRYFVDGSPTVGDVYWGGGGWRSVLVGTTGAGARSVYALDVTTSTRDSYGPGNVLWEFTHLDDADLGYTIGQARIVRTRTGRWVAVFGNGYNSQSHRAALFIVDVRTGELLRKILVGGGSAANPNGLATPLVFNATRGETGADTVYAGDLHGNMWKFDISSAVPGNWNASYGGQPLFVARSEDGEVQPITTSPSAIRHPDGGFMVLFGSGRYFAVGDNVVSNDPRIETFYGVWDNGAALGAARNQLVEQTITSEAGGFRQTTEHPLGAAHRGWYLDLAVNAVARGERSVSPSRIVQGRVLFETFRPIGDECNPGGARWLMSLNAISGTPGLFLPPGGDDGDDPPCDGAACGGAQLDDGPPSPGEPPVVIPDVPPPCLDGASCPPPVCDDPDDCEIAPAEGLRCPALTLPGLPGGQEIPIGVRGCGRQSWRQLR